MEVLLIPREPRRLGFEPSETFLKEVFESDVARSIWLLVSAQHLVGEDLRSWSMNLTHLIRANNPQSPKELHALIARLNHMRGRDAQYVQGSYDDVRAFVSRLFSAVKGTAPVEYRVELPETPSK